MITFTTNQWIILALVLLAGWLLGLMSRSGGAKWRAKYEAEHDLHTRLRGDHDALLKQHAVATEVRPVVAEARPVETRPVEVRPVEARPVEARVVETRPVETRATVTENRPVDARVTETHVSRDGHRTIVTRD